MAKRHKQKAGQLIGFPQKGCGDRSLFCDQYDRCLELACQRDWTGFNCQLCSYEKRGKLDFRFDEFAGLDEADEAEELLYCSEGEMDALLGVLNNQEDFLIMLIDGKAGDEK